MSSTQAMRDAWGPPCTGPFSQVNLNGEGKITVKSQTVPAWLALNAILTKHNYRTRRDDTGAYNCRIITGGTRYSLHAYGIAADINWTSNPYGPYLNTDMPLDMVVEIEALRTNSGARIFRWGGRYSGNKDAMHYEIFCTPAELATGIRTTQLPGNGNSRGDNDEMTLLIQVPGRPEIYSTDLKVKSHIKTIQAVNFIQFLLVADAQNRGEKDPTNFGKVHSVSAEVADGFPTVG